MMVATHKTKAANLAKQGQLAAARVQWQVVRTLTPNDPAVDRNLHSLQAMITTGAQKHMAAGNSALAKDRLHDAQRRFLAALALDPTHSAALSALREIESKRARQYQLTRATERKTEPGYNLELRPEVAKSPQSSPTGESDRPAPAVKQKPEAGKSASKPDARPAAKIAAPLSPAAAAALDTGIRMFEGGDMWESISNLENVLDSQSEHPVARDYLFKARLRLARDLLAQEDLSKALAQYEAAVQLRPQAREEFEDTVQDIKLRLAEQAYEKGVRALRSDVDKAIAEFEAALVYHPGHVGAKLYLQKAYKIRENLGNLTPDNATN